MAGATAVVGGGSARRREFGGGKEARRIGRAAVWTRQVLALQLGFTVTAGEIAAP